MKKPVAEQGQAVTESEASEAEREPTEMALKEQSQFFQALLTNPSIYVARIDERGTIIQSTGAGLKKIGLRDNQLEGMNVLEIYPHVQEHYRRALEGRTVQFIDCGNHQGRPWCFQHWLYPDRGPKGIFNIAIDVTELKQAEALSDDREMELKAISENIAGFMKLSRDMVVTEVTERMAAIFDLQPEEMVGRVWYDLVPPMEQRRPLYEKALAGEALHFPSAEVRFETGKRYFDVHYLPLRGRDGSVSGLFAMGVEITERKQTEDALRLIVEGVAWSGGDEFFRRLVRQLAAALEVKYSFVSEFAGTTRERLRLISFWTGTDYGENFEYAVKGTPCEGVVGKEVAFYPSRLQQRFPDDAWLREAGVESYLAIPLFDSAGDALGHLGVMHDAPMKHGVVSESILSVFAARAGSELERRRGEEALSESEARYRDLFAAAPLASWEEDFSRLHAALEDLKAQGVTDIREYLKTKPEFLYELVGMVDIIDVNEAALELVGATNKDELLAGLQRIFIPETMKIFEEEVVTIWEGRTYLEGESVFSTLQGEHIPIIVSLTVTGDPANYRRVIVTLTDITDLKRAEEETRISRERLTNLASRLLAVREEERAEIAREIHDGFGQALTGLKLDLSWLMRKLPKNRRTLVQRCRSMVSLLDSTLDKVRELSSQIRPAMLDELGLEAAIELQAREFESRTGCECQVNLSTEGMVSDRDRNTAVFRILQEALTNVARHAEASRVGIDLRAGDRELVMEVQDDGKGITEEAIPSTQSLGLIGMRERAAALGGRLHIGRGAGGGTVVTLRMPLDADGA